MDAPAEGRPDAGLSHRKIIHIDMDSAAEVCAAAAVSLSWLQTGEAAEPRLGLPI